MSDVLFVTAGPYAWGSSRMRGYWIAQRMGAQVIEFDELPKRTAEFEAAKTIIWQKSVDPESIKATSDKQHFWDVCDPLWWWNPDAARWIADRVAGVVCSSIGLQRDFMAWYGSGEKVHAIPDRLDLAHFPIRREHTDHRPIRFIWFGVSVNRVALYGAVITLSRAAANGYKVELTIYDDRPDFPFEPVNGFPIYHARWDVDHENEVIANHDIALLPKYPGPWGSVKSNNKWLTAWACGLPVTDGESYDQLWQLMDRADIRQREANVGHEKVQTLFAVDESVREWRAVLGD